MNPCQSLRIFSVATIICLLVSVFPPGTSAQTQPANNCFGASTWFKGSMRRLVSQTEYAEQFLNDAQPALDSGDIPSFDAVKYLSASADIKRLQAQEVGSNPPPAAETVSGLIAQRFDHLAAAYDLISQVNGDEDEEAMNLAVDEMDTAANLGVQIVPEMRAFVDECEMETNPTVSKELSCLQVSELKSSDWYKAMMGAIIYVTALESSGVQAVKDSDQAEVRETIQSLKEAAEDLDNETPPPGGRAFQDAFVNYIWASAELFTAVLNGSDADVDRASQAYKDASQTVQDEELSMYKPCTDLAIQ
jgi:hypothetical protein